MNQYDPKMLAPHEPQLMIIATHERHGLPEPSSPSPFLFMIWTELRMQPHAAVAITSQPVMYIHFEMSEEHGLPSVS